MIEVSPVFIIFVILAIIFQEIQLIALSRDIVRVAEVHNRLAKLVYEKVVGPVDSETTEIEDKEADR